MCALVARSWRVVWVRPSQSMHISPPLVWIVDRLLIAWLCFTMMFYSRSGVLQGRSLARFPTNLLRRYISWHAAGALCKSADSLHVLLSAGVLRGLSRFICAKAAAFFGYFSGAQSVWLAPLYTDLHSSSVCVIDFSQCSIMALSRFSSGFQSVPTQNCVRQVTDPSAEHTCLTKSNKASVDWLLQCFQLDLRNKPLVIFRPAADACPERTWFNSKHSVTAVLDQGRSTVQRVL